MKVLVTGATGFVGSAIVAAFRRAGHDVTGVVRTPAAADFVDGLGARAFVADIARPETLGPAIADIDAVVHAAFDMSGDAARIDRSFVEWALDGLQRARGLARFVYTSGVWVLGDTHGEAADERAPVDHPPAVVAWRPAVERLVAEARRDGARAWTIRPGIVYGGTGGIPGMLLGSLASTGSVTVVGDGWNRWPVVHREDLADLYVRVVERAPSEGLFHATDGSSYTFHEIAEAFARAGSGNVVRVPVEEARKTMGPLADALALDQEISSRLASRAVGWTPTHPSIVEEALALRPLQRQRSA